MPVDNPNELLGRRIRRLRQDMHQTQNELAASMGVSTKHFGELERGRGNPSLKSLQSLATALEISLSELFDIEQEEKSDTALREEIVNRLHTAKPEVLRAIHRALKS